MALVVSDNRGFTVIEFLVAVVILSVGLLGLLQSVNIAIRHNTVNELRLEGTQVADEEISRLLARGSSLTGFDSISTTTSRYFVSRRIPTSLDAFKNYSITRTGSSVTANTKQVTIQASWRYKNERFTQAATSLISKSQQ